MVLRKSMVVILILIVVTMGCAYSPPPVPVPPPISGRTAPNVLDEAQRAFDSGLYAEALEGFNTYLREDFHDRFADMALFRIGQIYHRLGRNTDALAVFERLIHEFPQGEQTATAKLEILNILYASGRFESVITQGNTFFSPVSPPTQQFAVLMIIADAYAALNAHLDASRFYYRAWSMAHGPDAETAWGKMKKKIEQLNAGELQSLIADISDKKTMGLLLYQLGLAFIMDEKYDDAEDVLSAFLEQFPDHPDREDAMGMVLSLTQRARFAPFTVGCLLPLSGAYAVFGQRALDSIELALSRFAEPANAMPFRLIVRDSRSDAEASEKALDELYRQKVGAIIGPMATSEQAASWAQARGIPIFVLTQREGITDIGAYVFRNFITPLMQVKALVNYTCGELGVSRYAILYPDENYGRRYMNLFWDQVIACGGTVNAVEAYDPDGTDFAQPIKKLAGIYFDPPSELTRDSYPRIHPLPNPIQNAEQSTSSQVLIPDPVERLLGMPLTRETIDILGRRHTDREEHWHPIVDFEAIFIPDAPKKAGLVIPQLAYYDIRDVYLLGTNLWDSQTLLEMSGDYMKHTIVVDGFFADSPSESIRQFVIQFREVYGRDPGVIEAVAYDSAMMVFQTMRQTATDSRRELKDALLRIHDFPGISGKTGFAPNGEAEKELEMLRIEHGRFVQVRQPNGARIDQDTPF